MRMVIDTNMIFSLLLGKNTRMRDVFFDPAHNVYAPNYIIGEVFEKKQKILDCSALSELELYELLYRILGRIQFVNEQYVTLERKAQAFNLCKDIDEDDTPFVALALELNGMIWTGDKRLKESLQKRGFTLFFEPAEAKIV